MLYVRTCCVHMLCVFACVCIFVCACVCVYVFILNVSVYVMCARFVHTDIHTRVHVCMYMHVNVSAHGCMYVHVFCT